jgi:hypothetical protein
MALERNSNSSSEVVVDFLSPVTEGEQSMDPTEDKNDNNNDDLGEDIMRLIELLGLPLEDMSYRVGDSSSEHDENDLDKCDCSGSDGFLAKIVGFVGPKCDKEKARLDPWIRHYNRRDNGGLREPARLAHLLLGRASVDTPGVVFPHSVKDFLSHDPRRSTS